MAGTIHKVLASLDSRGLLRTVDVLVSALTKRVKRRLYRWNRDEFGLCEALLWPDIDIWKRYSAALQQLVRLPASPERTSVLEVGAGGHGIVPLLKYSGWIKKFQVTLSDISERALSSANIDAGVNRVVGDGRELPFRRGTFDVVISIDTLEHMPEEKRAMCFGEFRRVAKRLIIVHLPIQTDDGLYVGQVSDRHFLTAHVRRFGREEPNTAEHLHAGHVSLEELRQALPGAEVVGTQNANVWLKYMVMSRSPLIRHLTGLVYLLFWKAQENAPPYHGCLVRYRASGRGQP